MQLHIQKDLIALSKELTDYIVSNIQETLRTKDRYSFVLSGGGTPQTLYKMLASPSYKEKIPWDRIDFFIGDERYVPFTDDRNNGKMIHETLLDHVPVTQNQIFLMNTNPTPEVAAKEYAKQLQNYFHNDEKTFDLILLGMGDDGHTLSLFPGTEVVHEKEVWVAAPFVKAQDMYRITLTAPVVNKSQTVVFLATGAKKATTLQEVLEGSYQPDKYPSQVIQPQSGNLHWYVDEAAANQLQNQ